MDEGVMVVHPPPPPPQTAWSTPWHLVVLRLTVILTMYYGLFSEGKNNSDGFIHLRIAMWMLYMADTVVFATRYMSKIAYNDSSDYFNKLGKHFVLRVLLNVCGLSMLLYLDVEFRVQTVFLSLMLSNIVDFLLLLCHNEEYERFTREDEQINYMERYRFLGEDDCWGPEFMLYFVVALRVATSVLYIWAMLFDHDDTIPSRHFPMRVLWCLLFLADTLRFTAEMNCDEPQTVEELSEYMTTMKKLQISPCYSYVQLRQCLQHDASDGYSVDESPGEVFQAPAQEEVPEARLKQQIISN